MPSTGDYTERYPRKTLQRIRREAGWKSARDFADRIGVSYSSYARWEAAGDGPGCGIPISQAWRIADELGCSIDLVVGREDIDAPRDRLSERASRLTRTSREYLGQYLDFLEQRDAAEAPKAGR